MAKYIKQEMPDLGKTGKKKCYYRMENAGNVSTDEFLKHICSHNQGITEGMARHVIAAVAEELSDFLAEGHTVKIDGIGSFRAMLGVRDGFDMDSFEGNAPRRNAQSIEVNKISYRQDSSLVGMVNRKCQLSRGETRRVNSSPYTKEERYRRLLEYLSEEGVLFIRVGEYAKMMGMPRSSAAVELRNWAADESRLIESRGSYSAKVYVKA